MHGLRYFPLISSWKKALLSHCIATHDDILALALELLQNPKNKDILGQLQKQFQYVFVDEFQGKRSINLTIQMLMIPSGV
jgi:superfamily I DNA/RNA helicase